MNKLLDLPEIKESLSSLANHTDIVGMMQAQRHIELAIESFTQAITAAYGSEAQQVQEDFVAAISQAELHIETWLGKLAYFHLFAERRP